MGAHRGKRPTEDPISTCPECDRYMLGVEVCPNKKCPSRRGTKEERARAEYQAKRKARELASKTAIGASSSKRIAGPDKDLLSKADSLLTLPADQLQDKVDKYLGAVRDFQLETDENGKPDRVSLARLVGRYVEMTA